MPEQLSNKTRLLLNFGGGIKAKISKFLQTVVDNSLCKRKTL
jgi:hypothetical protein